MNNTQMTQQQAAEQVIKLKKQYDAESKSMQGFHNTDRARELSSTANQIRQQFGLDDSKYGGGATLSDAYMNYHNEFGGQSNQGQQGGNISNQGGGASDRYGDADARLQGLLDMLGQSTNSSIDAQKAQYDKILEGQLADLERQLNEAVQQGEMSVNEAKEAFNSQKQEIEGLAYRQAEATKAYAGNLGIQHSPASIGMQQGDNARINKLHNTNMSDRDKRIADVKDRINLIRQQKSVYESQYRAEHGYNVAGAEAQAQQQYMQSVVDLMGKDYFAKQGFEHDRNMQDQLQQYAKENMDIQQDYNRENIQTEFQNKLKTIEFDSDLKIRQMKEGHVLKIEELDHMLKQDLTRMEAEFGYSSKLTEQQIQGQIRAASASANKQLALYKAKQDDDLAALKRSLDPNSDEYKFAELEIKRQGSLVTQKVISETRAGLATDVIMNNPNLPEYGSEYDKLPFDWTNSSNGGFGNNIFGNFANYVTDYSGKYEKHVDTIKAIDAVNRYLDGYNNNVPWATEKKKK